MASALSAFSAVLASGGYADSRACFVSNGYSNQYSNTRDDLGLLGLEGPTDGAVVECFLRLLLSCAATGTMVLLPQMTELRALPSSRSRLSGAGSCPSWYPNNVKTCLDSPSYWYYVCTNCKTPGSSIYVGLQQKPRADT